MSRLDWHIQQKIAQRDSINVAAAWLASEEGLVIEFGLGSGRSYSHLRERFLGREIFCFDRLNKAHPQSWPPASHLILGEFLDVLADPTLHARFAGRVILVHIDIGSGGPQDEVMPELLMGRIYPWLKPQAVVLSDQDLTLEPAWQLERVDTAGQVEYAACYHVYRRRAA
jgi:hypothetical protein